MSAAWASVVLAALSWTVVESPAADFDAAAATGAGLAIGEFAGVMTCVAADALGSTVVASDASAAGFTGFFAASPFLAADCELEPSVDEPFPADVADNDVEPELPPIEPLVPAAAVLE